jgi:hypothetical protein
MENGFIHDSQITASSYHSSTTRPQLGRLHQQTYFSDTDGWRPSEDDADPWFQVDFIAKVIVEEVQTQGRQTGSRWIKTYKLLYGDDGYTFTEYGENGVPKVSKVNVLEQYF